LPLKTLKYTSDKTINCDKFVTISHPEKTDLMIGSVLYNGENSLYKKVIFLAKKIHLNIITFLFLESLV